jgi:NADPH:quinone reductase-like Zn-dependent oxidoreductase
MAPNSAGYATEDLWEGLRRLTGGKGADIIFDRSAAPAAEARCARSPGRAASW